jgi:hypothetical protein
MNLMSPKSLVACLSIKVASESELTNLLIGWMQIQVNNQKLVTLPSFIPELHHAPFTPFSVAN